MDLDMFVNSIRVSSQANLLLSELPDGSGRCDAAIIVDGRMVWEEKGFETTQAAYTALEEKCEFLIEKLTTELEETKETLAVTLERMRTYAGVESARAEILAEIDEPVCLVRKSLKS